MEKKIETFCCYAHEDEALLGKLRAQLAPSERQGIIDVWSEADIAPGRVKLDELNWHLHTAQIILLLVSPDFMQSNYCYTIMQQAMDRRKEGTVHVIPVIL